MIRKTSPVSFESVSAPLDQVKPGDNVRRRIDPDTVAQLAGSMQVHGLLQPIGVTRAADGQYQLLWGYTRYLAAIALGWTSIRCLVLPFGEHRLLTLVENIVRQSLSTADEALAIYQVIKSGICPQNQLAKSLGRDKSYISRSKRLGELVEKMGTGVSWTKPPALYWELLNTPDLIPRAEAENWDQKTARENARRLKQVANRESLPLPPGSVPTPGKAKRPRRERVLTNEALQTFEPVVLYDDGFTVHEFSFSAKHQVDRELFIEKLSDLQVKIEHCIERLRKDWAAIPSETILLPVPNNGVDADAD